MRKKTLKQGMKEVEAGRKGRWIMTSYEGMKSVPGMVEFLDLGFVVRKSPGLVKVNGVQVFISSIQEARKGC